MDKANKHLNELLEHIIEKEQEEENADDIDKNIKMKKMDFLITFVEHTKLGL